MLLFLVHAAATAALVCGVGLLVVGQACVGVDLLQRCSTSSHLPVQSAECVPTAARREGTHSSGSGRSVDGRSIALLTALSGFLFTSTVFWMRRGCFLVHSWRVVSFLFAFIIYLSFFASVMNLRGHNDTLRWMTRAASRLLLRQVFALPTADSSVSCGPEENIKHSSFASICLHLSRYFYNEQHNYFSVSHPCPSPPPPLRPCLKSKS